MRTACEPIRGSGAERGKVVGCDPGDLGWAGLTERRSVTIIRGVRWIGENRTRCGVRQHRRGRVVSHPRSRVGPVIRESDLFSDGEWARTQRELGLSARQAQIVRLVLQGKADKQIASDLNISPATVRTHMRRLFAKFNLNDRLELTLLVLASLRGRVKNDQVPR